MRAGPRVLILLLAIAAAPGCSFNGETKKSGSLGEELTGRDLQVTVQRVDRKTPVPRKDITGLSLPSDGNKLVGVQVKVCSGHGAAIGPWHFSLETTAGDGRPKYTANNYRRSFDSMREGCEDGWIVYEIPRESRPTKVRFGFDHSGRQPNSADNLSARFDWDVD